MEMEPRKAHTNAIKSLLTSTSIQAMKRHFSNETIRLFMVVEVPECQLLSTFVNKKYLGMGMYGLSIKACLSDREEDCLAVKIVPYVSFLSLPITDPRRPENVEATIAEMLCKTLPDFPHVMVFMKSFICDKQKHPVFRQAMDDLLLQSDKLKEEPDLFDYRHYRVSLMEFADLGSLYDLLLNPDYPGIRDPAALEDIFLQLVVSLACIQDKFPTFRHHDLHLGNVLMRSHAMLRTYTTPAGVFESKLPGALLINDFDSAQILPQVVNSKLEFFFGPDFASSQYYDVHLFFNFFHSEDIVPPGDARKFMDKVVPEFIRGFAVYMKKDTLETKRYGPQWPEQIDAVTEELEPQGWVCIISTHRFIVPESKLKPLFEKHNFNPEDFYPARLLFDPFFARFKPSPSSNASYTSNVSYDSNASNASYVRPSSAPAGFSFRTTPIHSIRFSSVNTFLPSRLFTTKDVQLPPPGPFRRFTPISPLRPLPSLVQTRMTPEDVHMRSLSRTPEDVHMRSLTQIPEDVHMMSLRQSSVPPRRFPPRRVQTPFPRRPLIAITESPV